MAINISSNTVITNSGALDNITDATGYYSDFRPSRISATVSASTYTINMIEPVYSITMSANISFSPSNMATGRSTIIALDTNTTPRVPTFSTSSVNWTNDLPPTFSGFRYWLITFVAINTSDVIANATGYDFT